MSKFLYKQNREWLDIWGGIPSPTTDLDEILPELNTTYKVVSPFEFFKAWMEYKDESNVLLLHYSDVFNSKRKYIKKIADFIGVEISEEGLNQVESRTSVAWMKKNNNRYRHLAGPNKDISMLGDVNMVRSGGIGDGNKGLTKSQKEIIREMGIYELGPELFELMEKGFERSYNE